MFSPASNDAGASNCRRRPRRIRCRHVSTASPFVRRFALTALLSALLLPHFVIAAERPEPAQAGRAPMALALLSGPGMPGSTTELYRSEEHTSELQSLMRISYAVFCLQKKKKTK